MYESALRRDLLRSVRTVALVLATGVAASTTGPATAPLSLDDFMALSSRLTGHKPLDDDMGKNILQVFITAGRAEEIAALISDPASAGRLQQVADAIVAAWHSGLSPLAGSREVTVFNEALVWEALTYTKPWGTCGGEIGPEA